MQIGVDLNFAAQTTWLAPQLQFVPGLGPRKALALLKWVQRQDHVNARRPIYRGPDSSGCPLAKKVFWSVQTSFHACAACLSHDPEAQAYWHTAICCERHLCTKAGLALTQTGVPPLSGAPDRRVQQSLSSITDLHWSAAFCAGSLLHAQLNPAGLVVHDYIRRWRDELCATSHTGMLQLY